MTEKEPTQELMEKIKNILTEVATQAVLICPDIPNEDYYTNQLLALIIDTLKPDEMLAQWAKATGYVKLAKDQSPPDNPFLYEETLEHRGYHFARQDMLVAGWRKVEL